MEAIGLVATVAQLADFTGGFLLKLYQYYVDVREAPKNAEELRTHVGLSLSLLNALHQILPKSILTPSEYSALEGAMSAVHILLNQYNEKVKPENATGSRIWKWPLRKAEIRNLVSSLHEKNETFQWAITLLQMFFIIISLLIAY